jgi:polyhydroxyalkanoate synthesis regulator phasin
MAQNDLLKRYLDAGMQFTAMTQARAEAIVRDLVKAGEVQTEQTQTLVQDLLDRSRKNSEKLIDQVRKEIRNQISSLGLATQDDIARLEREIRSVKSSGAAKKSAR